jgi:imidazolonepropionase
MPILTDIRTLATCRADGGQRDVHAIAEAALVWQDGVITWLGPERDLPSIFAAEPRSSAGHRLVVPGLVDCHTHLAFGGWRADEFEARLRGKSYLEIARAGGGILRTVAATRSTPRDALVDRCRAHLAAARALGVTTVEAKSGYGLSLSAEITLLEVYEELGRTDASRVVPTFLGAHAVPPEFSADRVRYVSHVIEDMLPAVAARRLARFCDVFVEETAFSANEARAILEAARAHGLGGKLHADQLSNGGGAALAAELGTTSADHLECVSDAGIERLAATSVTAVSLPIASLYLRQPSMPARRLIEAGVPVAVATDFNPGSAPSFHLPLAMMLACTLQQMTPSEALKGATLYAARAIGLESTIGSLAPGKQADFAIIDAPDHVHWLYHFREDACVATYIAGRLVYLHAD